MRTLPLLLSLGLCLTLTTGCGDPDDKDDTGVEEVDADGDGFIDTEDCDDDNADINPDADEVCNGVDDDCDDATDEDDAVDASTWYADVDGDGYGDADATAVACVAPSGYIEDASDCDDGDDAVNPDADELCNGVDDDCDGDTDEDDALDASTWYADTDSDGYGDAAATAVACEVPSGYLDDDTDCDDTDAAVNPVADELCNEIDDDCDGDIDEDDALDASTWYADSDGDGYGDPSVTTAACAVPTGFLEDSTDCDDSDAGVNPAADEYCNEIDDDCDLDIDEDSAVDADTWYADSDGDGYGDAAVTTLACSAPTGYLADDTDCNDSVRAVNPGADELCNGVDDDCDGTTDEDDAIDASTWYADSDSDGFGDPSTTYVACEVPSGYLGDSTDCDDTDSAVNPDASEICNGVDDDCDATTSEDGLATLDGRHNFATIQGAIDAARPTSSVLVCDGTYAENLVIDDDLDLSSLNGSAYTTIDGGAAGSCVSVELGEVSIAGFTVTGGTGTIDPADPTYLSGGGLYIESLDPVTLSDLVVSDNEADFGAGLYAHEGTTVNISSSTFELNDADVYGGGLFLSLATTTLVDVFIEDNEGAWAGGICVDRGTLDLDGVSIDDNLASEYGGGVFVYIADVTATDDTTVSANTAGDLGGGIFVDDGSSWTGGVLEDNEADFGGGFYAEDSDGTANDLEDIICTDNAADTSGGCGYIYGDANITSVELTDNIAEYGGGLLIDSGTAYLMSSIIEENISGNQGGGAYLANYATLEVVNSDWGTGSTDNDPDDVYIDSSRSAYSSYTSAETFTCSDALGFCW